MRIDRGARPVAANLGCGLLGLPKVAGAPGRFQATSCLITELPPDKGCACRVLWLAKPRTWP